MANGEALAMAELKRSREEEVTEGGSKRVKQQGELFDEPLEAVAPPKQTVVSLEQESRLEIRDEEGGGGEVVHADNTNNTNSNEGDVEEEALRSDVEFVETEEEEESDEDEEYSDEDEDEEELHSPLPTSTVDRKGKGIVIDNGKGKAVAVEDYKGKGKAIVEEDDSSDDSDAGVENAEFLARVMEENYMDEADPLEEVDLNNILPTRTRRRKLQMHLMHPDEALGGEDDEDDEDYVLGGGSSHPGN